MQTRYGCVVGTLKMRQSQAHLRLACHYASVAPKKACLASSHWRPDTVVPEAEPRWRRDRSAAAELRHQVHTRSGWNHIKRCWSRQSVVWDPDYGGRPPGSQRGRRSGMQQIGAISDLWRKWPQESPSSIERGPDIPPPLAEWVADDWKSGALKTPENWDCREPALRRTARSIPPSLTECAAWSWWGRPGYPCKGKGLWSDWEQQKHA
ncbi:hypothetical protein NDU88_000120 [Pleurodeles waltl]|uniref:Uncharacterized protein n=1 Tax=Pleurodeles waltl TaxID=8319 RepID=A0AAV7VSJ6_PLEWA|nr:hypothetical protein NDU88_000120 [Pleurodeles waltl]